MQTSNKPGLADLKRLRQQAQAADAPTPAPAQPKRPGAAKAGKTSPETPKAAAATSADRGADPLAPPLALKDKALFRQAVKSAQPLAPVNRALLPPAPVASKAMLKQRRQAAAGVDHIAPATVSDHYAPALVAADASHFVQTGHGPDLLKGLARGKWPIDASLDLHGATLDEARPRLDAFLRSCLQHRIRCVRIVHGKGYGSKNNAPVLKETVRRWLTQLDDVMAYIECAERDGGAGAVQVLLRG